MLCIQISDPLLFSIIFILRVVMDCFLWKTRRYKLKSCFLDIEFVDIHCLVTLFKLPLVVGVRRSHGKVIATALICSKFVQCTSIIYDEHCDKGNY